ncbi:hypothetical protein A9762_20865 [Pandoraea sp. ISTKB]|nr:hypothetical protein A9762_20865 [Pandoraea sp. ISTKB]
MSAPKIPEHVREAMHAHTDLNTFGVIVAILEGGCLYRNDSQPVALKMIQMCNKEMQRLLKAQDAAIVTSRAKGDLK